MHNFFYQNPFIISEILTSIKGHNSVSHNIAYTKFHHNPSFVLKILNGNKIRTSIKGHNSVEIQQKTICNCHYQCIYKFYQNPSTGLQDIEHMINEISTSIKGHNSV